jgi:acyl dehydratase
MASRQEIHLAFEKLPTMMPLYAQSLLPRRRAPEHMPEMSAQVHDVTPLSGELARYRQLCGMQASSLLPVSYPQLLAGPLHAAIVCHREFPFPAMGLVHVRNVIRMHRPCFENLPLDLVARVHEARPVARGHEFYLHSFASFRGELVWESTTTVLSLKRVDPGQPRASSPTSPSAEAAPNVYWETAETVELPPDLGRAFAALSGDWNPIHVSAPTARLFGFPRAIIHGMWTFGRALGSMDGLLPNCPATWRVDFRRPVLLPSTISIQRRIVPRGVAWRVIDSESERELVSGTALQD